MDEKQIEAFEEKYGKRPSNDAQRADAWDDRLRVWLACYQHLAPQLKDAARYQWLRDIDNEQEAFSAIHEFADKFLDQAIDAAIDRKKDAAREQEKKNAQE